MCAHSLFSAFYRLFGKSLVFCAQFPTIYVDPLSGNVHIRLQAHIILSVCVCARVCLIADRKQILSKHTRMHRAGFLCSASLHLKRVLTLSRLWNDSKYCQLTGWWGGRSLPVCRKGSCRGSRLRRVHRGAQLCVQWFCSFFKYGWAETRRGFV